MTIARKPLPQMTVQDFIAWAGDGKYELVEGTPRAMSPASATHGAIQANAAYLIKRHLVQSRSRCQVMTEPAVVPRLRADANLRVPDLGVTCTPSTAGQVAVPDPILVVEILSPGNEADTRGNVWAYASIPSLQEILLISSTRIAAELLRRHPDGSWPGNPEMLGSADTVTLEAIGLRCSLIELYDGTHLDESQA